MEGSQSLLSLLEQPLNLIPWPFTHTPSDSHKCIVSATLIFASKGDFEVKNFLTQRLWTTVVIMTNDHTCHSKATNVILMNGCGLRYGPCFVFVFFSVFARLCRDPGARKSKT